MSANTAERLMTLAQAAESSGVSTKTLRRAIEAGELEACRLGTSAKSDRIHPTDLRIWWARRKLSQCQSQSAPTAAIKSPSATADERIEKLLGTGAGRTPKSSNGSGLLPSRKLQLVASRKGS